MLTRRRSAVETADDRHRRLADHLRRHRPELADRRAAAPGAPPRRGRGDVPGQLRRRAHRRAPGRHDRPDRRAATRWRSCSPCRRSRRSTACTSATTTVRVTSSSRSTGADVGERRLLRAAAGDLRRHPRERRPRRGRLRPLARRGQLLAYPYRGFWQPADTVKERGHARGRVRRRARAVDGVERRTAPASPPPPASRSPPVSSGADMLTLPGRADGRPPPVALIGAHCDDLEIGAGATLLQLAAGAPGCASRRRADVDPGPGRREPRRARGVPARARTVAHAPRPARRAAARALGPHQDPLEVRGTARRTPTSSSRPRRTTPTRTTALLGELVTTVFRDHLVLRLRDPQVGRRSGPAQRLRPGRAGRRRAQVDVAARALRLATRARLVRPRRRARARCGSAASSATPATPRRSRPRRAVLAVTPEGSPA